MIKRTRTLRTITAGFALGIMMTAALSPTTALAVTGAAFTTVNEAVDNSGHCANGNPNVNCNIYDGKQYVWMSGGPIQAAVGDGTYFFAVLDPGGQNDPNDGAAANLSDISPTTNTGAGDAYTDRTFSISGGVISYAGPHDFANNKIRLVPYDDTTNPGGVYILAICSLANGYPVSADSCKYDAFKVGGTPPADLTVSKDAHATLDRTSHWSITKDADKTSVTQAGGNVTFNYTVAVSHGADTDSNIVVTGHIAVSNPNAFAVDVNVSDAVNDPNGACLVDGAATLAVSVPGNGSLSLPYTCTYTATPASLNDINTVTITWQGFGTGQATYQFPFTFAVNSIDECVNVADSVQGALGTVCVGDANPKSFTYAVTQPGQGGTCTNYPNTATFTTNDSGAQGSASKTVTVCVPLDLTASKTASPAFNRTFHWNISKSVDKTLVKQVGGSATFNYQVNVTKDSGTDSNWVVSGNIVVSNPNDFFDLSGVNVSDAVNNGGTCTVTNGSNVIVPKSGSVTLAYTCTYAAAPSANAGTNTATATWDQAAFSTPSGSASGSANFVFGSGPTPPNPSLVDNCVNVTDTFNGVTTGLGTTCATQTYSYARTISIPAYGCLSYPNTATFTTNTSGSTGSASQSVRVCGPVKTGALTIGFWQNKNGQDIIKAGSATTGVCNAATWLRQFAPFQDLGATASCSTTATYVFNVIKAANASGAAMNAMLKAQTLATALNVYFSDPALGGNKISAPAPVGGVAIDLTKVCKDIAACSIYENVSSAFGGAGSLTISQMLSYASSQSNAGGVTWYANVKTTQELAKDAFDAINNQVAFGT